MREKREEEKRFQKFKKVMIFVRIITPLSIVRPEVPLYILIKMALPLAFNQDNSVKVRMLL
jgi:hypothetical protein